MIRLNHLSARMRMPVVLAAIGALLLASCVPIPPAAQPAAAPSTAPAAAPTAQTVALPPTNTIHLDTQGLPYSWQPNVVPATPYVTGQPGGPTGLPEHIQINFGVTDPQDRKPADPIMYVIPVTAYEQLWDSAADPYVSMNITHIYSSTVALQNPPPTRGMAALPPESQITTAVNDLAVQIGRAASDGNSASKSGFRFVGRWAQGPNPVTSDQPLWYTYQGFTNDGTFLVSFFYPVTTAKLPKQADLSADEMNKFNSDPTAYITAQAEMLNTLAPADWSPDLTQLDKLVGSLQIDGMVPTGLQGNVWQWLGTSWYELKDGKYVLNGNPIADPTKYEVVYGADGKLTVKADCNNASGAYTYDGGMVGGVRVQMGPTTLAACAADSRSDELIQSLMAAQDFRVQPGGMQLELNMPAGGPVLSFQSAGPAPK
jgi:hypothetical protein